MNHLLDANDRSKEPLLRHGYLSRLLAMVVAEK